MCGICGIINTDSTNFIDKSLLAEMRDVMRHRGPDDAGAYINKNVGIAHRRLSIIDLSSGHQPISNEDGTVWIVFNGEIYNYAELRKELEIKGHQFRTMSDTETIIHAYEEHGENCLEKFRGMFAFAIWDQTRRQLFLARDRLGKKPLYYCMHREAFSFSSEIKALLHDRRVERKLNEKALHFYLTVRYVPGPDTMFEGIWKLQPGHYMVVKNGNVKLKRYWDLAHGKKCEEFMCQSEYVEEKFEEILQDCIKIRLMSEVPLGVSLSGGLDSSVVVALMSKLSNTQLKTFCIGYEGNKEDSEFEYARSVAQRYETDHHEFYISDLNFFDFIPKYVWFMDEPISDSAAIPLYYLSKFSREYVTVILSGEGADEILGGYYIYKKMLLLEKFRQVPGHNTALTLFNYMKIFGKHSKYIHYANLSLHKRYKGVSRVFMPHEIDELFITKMDYEEELDLIYADLFKEVEKQDALTSMLYVDLKTWLPDDLLMKADKMTMASSQELRVPYLDHKMVEYCFSLPTKYKINRGVTKYLLRKIASKHVPTSIINREKKGFFTPIKQWFRGDLNECAKQVLLDPASACSTYFNRNIMEDYLNGHKNRVNDYSEQIWNLLVFEYWHQCYIIKNNAKVIH